MLTVYIIAALIGGGLIILSLFGGDHDHDHDFGGHDVDGADSDSHIGTDSWIPFLSLRFWTYFFAGFGLTGVLLKLFSDATQPVEIGVSLAVGLVCGLFIAGLIRFFNRSEVDTSSTLMDTLGLEGQVVVPIRSGYPGKVRCRVKGEIIDYLAISDDQGTLEAGAPVVVVSVEGDKLRVIARDALFEESAILRSQG